MEFDCDELGNDWICPKCRKICDVYQEINIDSVPYGDRYVEMRTASWPVSICCNVDAEEIKGSEFIH